MSYQVLARKWRPKNFSEVIGQPHIIRTLMNSVKSEKIAHAYLLTGTRGVGKTTIARIFAKAIRCTNKGSGAEPCLTCAACVEVEKASSLDYIEIDGASNNSVEDVRELIENVQYLPTTGKYKVYVVDEVHMLTVNAFNALLKTLEEPPAHVVFIFATTDPQKLLGTVLSRCQRLDFKNVSREEIASHLKNIAVKEEIKFESERIPQMIAKYARGSIRDSLSILDQVISLSLGKTIKEDEMTNALGLISNEVLGQILEALFRKDKQRVVSFYKKALNENIDLKVFAQQILDEVFKIIESIDHEGNFSSDEYSDSMFEGISMAEVVWLYETLSKDLEWALSSMQPEQTIGFVLAKSCLRDQILTGKSPQVLLKKKIKSDQQPEPEIEPAPQEIVTELTWQGFLDFVIKENRALAVNLEHGNISNTGFFDNVDSRLKITFDENAKIFFDFLNDPENKEKLIEQLRAYTSMADTSIELELISLEVKEEKNFKSTVEIHEKNLKDQRDQQKKEILENKYVQDAEKLFNTKVDKVVLNNKG